MPSLVYFGIINQNTPQQNAGIFLGEGNIGGWDANIKLSQGHGGTYGFFNMFPAQFNLIFDNFEVIDGAIIDPDVKASIVANA